MNEEQVRRRARNEALFRSLNEQINDMEIGKATDPSDPIDFVCECSSAGCMKVVSVSLDDYEAVREAGSTFIVAPGHEEPEIEDVVERHGDFSVVEKRGDAGAVAEEANPRD